MKAGLEPQRVIDQILDCVGGVLIVALTELSLRGPDVAREPNVVGSIPAGIDRPTPRGPRPRNFISGGWIGSRE